MTPTETLRALLDERGVEYEGGERSLRWRDRYGIMMQAFPLANGELGMGVWSCTPEQAIAATLGRGTCKVEGSIDYGEFGCWQYDLSCGCRIIWPDSEPPVFCPECGRRCVG